MMTILETQSRLQTIQTMLAAQDLEGARILLLSLHPADRAEIFRLLEDTEQQIVLPLLNIPQTAELFEELEDAETLDVIESLGKNLSSERLADILDEMDPDEAADLLGDLPPEQASQALSQMEDADEVLPLLSYPDETAGGLMTTSFVAMRRNTTVRQALDFLANMQPDIEVPNYLYVIDGERHLVGIVPLNVLVRAHHDNTMVNIMNPNVYVLSVHADQEEVAHQMARYDLAFMPVVDDENRLVGVVTHDDIVDVLQQETTEDILHLGGVEAGPLSNKPYWSQRLRDIVRSRFTWLLILFIAETFTGTVLRHYEDELSAVVSLSFFIPLLIGTGGNAGSQTVAGIIRALALKEVSPEDVWHILQREMFAGLLLGVLIGLVAFGRAMLWGVEIQLAQTVGITVAAICLWANVVATLVPLAATRIGLDPTILSGPLMTTLIDGTGLIIYFSIAAWILPEL
ncbi:MAG: magnesium transporter [Anaerolineales bacterium]